MAKKTYTIIKLAPQVSSWCDKENNIYLSRPNKISKRLKDGCDMKMINKGVKAGLIVIKDHCEEVESVAPKKHVESVVQKTIPELPKEKEAEKIKEDVVEVSVKVKEKSMEEVVEEIKEEAVEEAKERKSKSVKKEK